METVFITIHDLSLDARIKYVSDSIEYILGYLPHEVKGKSCWEYFHPDEIPFARAVHGRGLQLDKASVIKYCQIKHRDGYWVGCECVFTVVYDVLVASTSIYKRGPRSHQRAVDSAGIRRIFSSSPRDPRYHMLSFISTKFYQEPRLHEHEPRAALFLNRFTRTSTVMFATNGVSTILGIRPDQIIGKSFYFCIAENCLKDAVRCLESAKANDSIAYLRFWYRDPIEDGQAPPEQPVTNGHISDEDDDEGGVPIAAIADTNPDSDITANPVPEIAPESIPTSTLAPRSPPVAAPPSEAVIAEESEVEPPPGLFAENRDTRESSGNSTDLDGDAADAIFDRPALQHSSSSSATPAEDNLNEFKSLEVEAVVSCTSDGLVVVLRKARPLIPLELDNFENRKTAYYANGLFASPWATEPVLPPDAPGVIPPEAAAQPGTEPEGVGFMQAIREAAVFAWSLTGINGTLAQFGQGTPTGEALPPGGFPVWDPTTNEDPENKYNGFLPGSHRNLEDFEDLDKTNGGKKEEETSSDDEVLWKRLPDIPAWRRPARRAREEAFGEDADDEDAGERDQQSRRRRIRHESSMSS